MGPRRPRITAPRDVGAETPLAADDPWAGEDASWASEDAASEGDEELIRPARGIALAVATGVVTWAVVIALLLSWLG
ncbi:MAG TPA: hypothetical protein VD704_05340 [Gaiellaceae bacterium]|nr:hypothetical protein [Gaiellaceae bacterium]